jgi:hypothetical protein
VSPPETPAGPGGEPRAQKDTGEALSAAIVAEPTDSACEAFAVLVFTPTGKHRRRVFLSLHSATAAAHRAQAKGQPVRIVLCRLQPVAADLDLNER